VIWRTVRGSRSRVVHAWWRQFDITTALYTKCWTLWRGQFEHDLVRPPRNAPRCRRCVRAMGSRG